jgi:3-oxoacyl-[acyl-carrier protein] reductase
VGSVVADGFAEQFVKTALDNFGGVDIIVNNAGYTIDSLINKMTDEAFDAIYKVHLKAPFQILRAASTYIIETAKKEAEEGREIFRKVVNISSVAGTGGNVGQANYSSMKAGVLGLTKTLSKEWGRYKVNVNCVAFGIIETRLTESTDVKKTVMVDGKEVAVGIPAKVKEGFAKMIPLGRPGTPEEAAGPLKSFLRIFVLLSTQMEHFIIPTDRQAQPEAALLLLRPGNNVECRDKSPPGGRVPSP